MNAPEEKAPETRASPPPESGAPALPPLPPPNGRDAVTLLLGALILLCGVAIGAGGTYIWLSHRQPRRRPFPPTPAGQITAEIGERYGLNASQKKKLSEVIERHLKSLHEVRRQTEQAVTKVHTKMREDMARILNPEQFAQWTKELDARRRRFFRFGGPRSGHGGPGRGRGWPGSRMRGMRRPNFMGRRGGGGKPPTSPKPPPPPGAEPTMQPPGTAPGAEAPATAPRPKPVPQPPK